MAEELGHRAGNGSPAMRVTWHRRARQDLRHLRTQIAEENPQAAQRVAQRILQAVELLAEQPGMGRVGRVPNRAGTRDHRYSLHCGPPGPGRHPCHFTSAAWVAAVAGAVLRGTVPGMGPYRCSRSEIPSNTGLCASKKRSNHDPIIQARELSAGSRYTTCSRSCVGTVRVKNRDFSKLV